MDPGDPATVNLVVPGLHRASVLLEWQPRPPRPGPGPCPGRDHHVDHFVRDLPADERARHHPVAAGEYRGVASPFPRRRPAGGGRPRVTGAHRRTSLGFPAISIANPAVTLYS